MEYSYDNNGNTTSKTVSGGTTNYTWDYENRLASVTLPSSGGTTTLKYDPFGRRIQKSFTQGSTTTTTNYLYDGDNDIEEVNASGSILARYAQTLNIDEPLAESQSSTTSFYEADGLGSVTSLTNSSAAVVASFTYDSFGNLTASSGTLTNPFRYTGREFDSETGVYYYRARYYDPQAGRLTSEDPIGMLGGVNRFEYVFNSPLNLIDPSGLAPRWDPKKHRTRECNAGEYERCVGICGAKGVRSCRVAQQLRITRMKNGPQWTDGPLSCDCNDPDDPVPVCPLVREKEPRWQWSPNWNKVGVGVGVALGVGVVITIAVTCPECFLVMAPAAAM
ncbi:MAG: RHS repeat-associated core domain-containing protein [Candidatus Acidiferrales bacterium]